MTLDNEYYRLIIFIWKILLSSSNKHMNTSSRWKLYPILRIVVVVLVISLISFLSISSTELSITEIENVEGSILFPNFEVEESSSTTYIKEDSVAVQQGKNASVLAPM